MYKIFLLGVFTLLIMSCNEKKEKSEAIGDIRGVTWLLSDIGDKTLNNDIKTTLVFGDEDKISGNAGCNNYFGSYELYPNGIKISNIGSTRKMCSEDVMEQEMTYLGILQKANSIKFTDYKLEIDSKAEITSIKFVSEKNQ